MAVLRSCVDICQKLARFPRAAWHYHGPVQDISRARKVLDTWSLWHALSRVSLARVHGHGNLEPVEINYHYPLDGSSVIEPTVKFKRRGRVEIVLKLRASSLERVVLFFLLLIFRGTLPRSAAISLDGRKLEEQRGIRDQ